MPLFVIYKPDRSSHTKVGMIRVLQLVTMPLVVDPAVGFQDLPEDPEHAALLDGYSGGGRS